MNQNKLNKICDNGKMVICYDLDDTLIDFETLQPIKEPVDRISELRKRFNEGNYIIIQTARRKSSRSKTKKLLCKLNIPFNELICGTKPKAHIYIDDSGVNADDYFNNPHKYLKLYRAIGFRINYLIRYKGGIK